MKIALLLIATTFAASAHAQYKCEGPGGVSFQQTPCPAGAKESQFGPPKPSPQRRAALSADRPAEIRDAYREGRVVPGMFLSEVHALAGRAPDAMNTLTTAAGTRDQWVYRMRHRTIYVYMETDVVTAVQVVER